MQPSGLGLDQISRASHCPPLGDGQVYVRRRPLQLGWQSFTSRSGERVLPPDQYRRRSP